MKSSVPQNNEAVAAEVLALQVRSYSAQSILCRQTTAAERGLMDRCTNQQVGLPFFLPSMFVRRSAIVKSIVIIEYGTDRAYCLPNVMPLVESHKAAA
jgi:hypothetical protein